MKSHPIQDSSDSAAARREMLLHDVYELPLEETPQGSIYDENETAIETVPRQWWCIYSDDTVSTETLS